MRNKYFNRAYYNEITVKNMKSFPAALFKHKGLQEVEFSTSLKKGKYERYELTQAIKRSLAYYLVLAYCIIKKNMKVDGCNPINIAIELSKGNILENTFNFELNKENIDRTLILDFANFVDDLDVEITLFIVWTEPKKSPQSKKTRGISGTIRQNVLMRDNYTCQICGATVKDGAKLEIDHIIPYSKGGTNDENNLQVLCQQCNREKHNRTDLLHDKHKLEELGGDGL